MISPEVPTGIGMSSLGAVVRWRGLRNALLVALAVVASGCADEFARADAVTSLQTTGVTEPEAMCMADTLALLGELTAADPRQDRTEAAQDALVKASSRCVGRSGQAQGSGVGASQPAVNLNSASSELAATSGELEAGQPLLLADDPAEFEALRDQAIATLVGVGRSEANATCIVDHVAQVDAQYLFADPEFGLGLDPFEADAFAACLSVP